MTYQSYCRIYEDMVYVQHYSNYCGTAWEPMLQVNVIKREIIIWIVEKRTGNKLGDGVCLCAIYFTVDVSWDAETNPHHTA